jgi:hypothetical protein
MLVAGRDAFASASRRHVPSCPALRGHRQRRRAPRVARDRTLPGNRLCTRARVPRAQCRGGEYVPRAFCFRVVARPRLAEPLRADCRGAGALPLDRRRSVPGRVVLLARSASLPTARERPPISESRCACPASATDLLQPHSGSAVAQQSHYWAHSAPSGSARAPIRRAFWAGTCAHRGVAVESRHGEHHD